jgi:hypothetical protein
VDDKSLAHPSTEDHDQDERPHACNDGWVTIGQIAVDPETGEETEEYAQYLCRKCAKRTKLGVESTDWAGASFGGVPASLP